MDLLTLVEDAIASIRNTWLGWKGRLRLAISKLEKDFDPKRCEAVLDLLRQAHDQAQKALNGEPVIEPRVPWELAHGLSLLGRLDGRKELPKKPGDIQTCVQPDGTLLGCSQWELLDYRWTEALVAWLEHLDDHAHFGTTPALLTIPNEVVFAIAGDWGTGPFEQNAPATLVTDTIEHAAPDFTIHLGDVYYAGSKSEEKDVLKGWPRGKLGSFTLNSNHEMYSGAIPYFKALQSEFPLQQNTSYFALQNDYWLIIGLDSAYASDPWNLYMDGNLNRQQLDWLRNLPKNKSVIVLSHGQGYDIDGDKKTNLYDQVVDALGRVPAYWYWGHLHNAICYAERDGLHGRCVGHGSIPYGDAPVLKDKPNVVWYERQLAGDNNYPDRVLNGWVKVILKDSVLAEQFIGEDGSVRWQPPQISAMSASGNIGTGSGGVLNSTPV